MSDVILTDVSDGVAVGTLNRPDARRASSAEPRRALPRTLTEPDADPAIRVPVVTSVDPGRERRG